MSNAITGIDFNEAHMPEVAKPDLGSISRFNGLEDHWVNVGMTEIVMTWLKGQWATTYHHTDQPGKLHYFEIIDVKVVADEEYPEGRIFVRGENTFWLGQKSFKINVCPM